MGPGTRRWSPRVIGWCASADASGSGSLPDPRSDQRRAHLRDIRDTDWSQVVALYDQLVRLDPSPIITLNRAIAVAELDGPEVALAAVDRLEDR